MSEQSTASGVDDVGDGAPTAGSSGDDGGPATAADPDDGSAARVVGLDSADAETVIGAVSSDTARSILATLEEEPATASGLAEHVDCSLQTVQYHLGKLSDAGLVAVEGSTTSEKGREMDVYAPAGQPVVVYAGNDDDGDDIRSMLSRLVSGVAFLGLLSLLVQELFGREPGYAQRSGGDSAVSLSADAAEGAGSAAGVEPGLVFFAGGLVVLAAYVAVWYLRRRETLDGVLPAA